MTNTSTSTATLITGATVLPVDPAVPVLPRGDLLIRDDLIADVGPDLVAAAGPDALIVDGAGMIAIPGFVDSHLHAWEAQLRGVAPQVDFAGYLGLTAFGAGPRYSPNDVRTGVRASALTALAGGITTLVDNAHDAVTPDHARAAVEGLRDAGIRGVSAVGAPFGADPTGIAALAAALRDEYAGPLLGVRCFEVNPSVDSWREARDLGLWVSTELGPHTPGLDAVFQDLAAAGLLGPDHALNHCYDLSSEVWSMIGHSGAAVNLCPRSDVAFALGSAVSPVARARAAGVAIGLSNDNEVSYGIDMFAEMATLHLRHRGEVLRRRAAGEPEVEDLDPAALLHFATLGGAANAGLADLVGSLTPGKQADVVLLRVDDGPVPVLDPLAAVTAFARPSSVDTVMVAGRMLKRHGRLLDPGLDQVRSEITASRARLGISAG
jgi:5-methylthioadenosine/S-adenosylhomocysteine deaminase